MKRNFLTGMAMMVAVFFIGSEIAWAADLSFGGHWRTRYTNSNHGAFANTGGNTIESIDGTNTRVRLNTKAKITSDTSAFIQLQSVHTWGNETSVTGNDNDTTVGVHQSFVTIKNFFGQPLTAKAGRQEVVLDGHRLFGHTGWSDFAHTHDAIRFTHSGGNHTMQYIYSKALEGDTSENDVLTHVWHNNFQGVLGGALSTYVVLEDDDCGILNSTSACSGGGSPYWTIGGRQAGKMYGLDYRAEYYYQFGGAGGAADVIPMAATSSCQVGGACELAGYTTVANRDAYMFGIRVGKSFSNVMWKPKITLWYDYLSGNDDETMKEGDWGAFDTMYDTGHKFYGFMDFFTNRFGAGSNYMGLQDAAVKIVLKPRDKWTLKADLHNFHLAHSVGANPDMAIRTGLVGAGAWTAGLDYGTAGSAGRNHGTEIGSELDLTLIHAYNSNVKFNFGYSLMMAEALYHALDATGGAGGKGHENVAHWAYAQAMVKF